MTDDLERIVDGLESGRIGRREALRALGAVFAAAAAAGAAGAATAAGAASAPDTPGGASTSTFRGLGLDHLALRVTDVGRARRFYTERFGLETLSATGDSSCFLRAGDHFLALFRAETPGLDHWCMAIEDYEPAAAMRALRDAGHEPVRRGNRVYFRDPDGIEVQVTGAGGAWSG